MYSSTSSSYMTLRDDERRSHFALTAFDVFLKKISSPAASLLFTLLSLLSSLTAYSIENGMTPSKISRLFDVLLFGLHEDESFARTYDAFTRGSNASMRHENENDDLTKDSSDSA
ncbi:hypothetical protein A4X13_0g8452 [Tilletia indica]|uniref:Meiotically up-regulated protein Msb1/Mug8 domain-containing protein n=1 Tax=Tilletia indica TaxID=43049 RepID=A0A177TP97_9BASI|nr:hypothetical protein A4X13_0g8452 [Tilletia indica]